MPKSTRWTPEEHAQLLVAIIKTGNPKIDTPEIAAFLNNGRTAGGVYFEIRRIKLSVEGGFKNAKRARNHGDEPPPSPPQTPVKAEPRPVRAVRPSAAKRRLDEAKQSGFWDSESEDESGDERAKRPAKRVKGRVMKVEDGGSEVEGEGGGRGDGEGQVADGVEGEDEDELAQSSAS